MNIFEEITESLTNYFKDIFTNYKKSSKWKEFFLGFRVNHCLDCIKREYKIYDISNEPLLPLHERCGCYLDWLRSLQVGQASILGNNGPDYYLKHLGILPNYYITKEDAKKLGWSPWKGNLDKVAPGKMIGGNIFDNRQNKLPSAPDRVWYECDIDYNGGYRNNYRLIYSNDGLMFKTDNHYTRFIIIE